MAAPRRRCDTRLLPHAHTRTSFAATVCLSVSKGTRWPCQPRGRSRHHRSLGQTRFLLPIHSHPTNRTRFRHRTSEDQPKRPGRPQARSSGCVPWTGAAGEPGGADGGHRRLRNRRMVEPGLFSSAWPSAAWACHSPDLGSQWVRLLTSLTHRLVEPNPRRLQPLTGRCPRRLHQGYPPALERFRTGRGCGCPRRRRDGRERCPDRPHGGSG